METNFKSYLSLFPSFLLGLSMKHSMRSSSFPTFLGNLQSKKDRYMKLERFGLFLLWSLALTSIFIFFILYSPTNPFNPTGLKQDLNEKSLLINPKRDYEKCDLFNGRWVPNLNGSIYTNWSCPLIPDSKNCGKHGREDVDFLNWRWKPYGCELSRFDSKIFLRIVRGKTLAFIGDSVARNQMESLLCLLSQEETPTDMYKDSEDRFRTWYFPSHNFTLMILWTKFLVVGDERVINGSNSGVFNLHLDKADDKWTSKLPAVDYAIISAGHWFFRMNYLYDDGKLIGCVYCNEPNITGKGPEFAFRRAFWTALSHINGCKECKGRGLMTLVRTFSPAHFENGNWDTGGNCNKTSPLSEREIGIGGTVGEFRRIQLEETKRAKKKGKKRGMRFVALDVTKAMLMRPDGHPDTHWDNKWMKGYSDCVHWCLPGPIDTWNDMLMALLGKEDGLIH